MPQTHKVVPQGVPMRIITVVTTIIRITINTITNNKILVIMLIAPPTTQVARTQKKFFWEGTRNNPV